MKLKFIFSSLLIFIFYANSTATTIGFGNFVNSGNKKSFDYLEQILPNSLASTLSTMFNTKIIKPANIEAILKEKDDKQDKNTDKDNFKAPYRQQDLIKISDYTGSDIFIYGYYTPQKNNEIKIKINIFINDTKEIFSFIQIGKMETEIFRLVDKLSISIVNLSKNDYYFKSFKIPDNSKIAFITNISGKDLNSFYIPFLEKNFNIASIQSNTLRSQYPLHWFNRFKYLTTENTKIEISQTDKKLKYPFSPWMSNKIIKNIKAEKQIINKYYYKYVDTKKETLDKLLGSYKNTIDYLFIIGFNKGQTKAWLRCIDLRRQDIIWIETGIPDSGSRKINIMNISENILKNFDNVN